MPYAKTLPDASWSVKCEPPPTPLPYERALPGAQVRATSRARAVRESLVRVSHLLIGHDKLPLSQWGAVRVCLLGAFAAPKRIQSKKDRRAPHARSARQQRHIYFSSLSFFL